MIPKHKLILYVFLFVMIGLCHIFIVKNAEKFVANLAISSVEENEEVVRSRYNLMMQRHQVEMMDCQICINVAPVYDDIKSGAIYVEKKYLAEKLVEKTTFICVAIYLILSALALKEIFSLSKPIVLRRGKKLGVIAGDAVQKMMNQESKLNNELKLAQEEFDRLKIFLSDGLISEDDFEKSKLNVQQKIRTILAELESLKKTSLQ